MSYTRFFCAVHLIHAWFEAMKNYQILFKQHCISGPDKQSQGFFCMHTLLLISTIPSNTALMKLCGILQWPRENCERIDFPVCVCVCVQQVLLILWGLYNLSWFHFSSVERLIHWQPFPDNFFAFNLFLHLPKTYLEKFHSWKENNKRSCLRLKLYFNGIIGIKHSKMGKVFFLFFEFFIV